jgi:hypothetical protein
MHRHHGLRDRSAWRYRNDRCWRPGGDSRDRLSGRLHVDRCRLGNFCGNCAAGLTTAHGRLRRGGRSHGVSFWRDVCLWFGRRDDLEDATPQRRRGRRRWNRGTPASNRRLDRCLLRWTRERFDSRLRGCEGRRHEDDAQLGRFDASFLPGEAQARKPKSRHTEGQAQQRAMNQQREHSGRDRQSAGVEADDGRVARGVGDFAAGIDGGVSAA